MLANLDVLRWRCSGKHSVLSWADTRPPLYHLFWSHLTVARSTQHVLEQSLLPHRIQKVWRKSLHTHLRGSLFCQHTVGRKYRLLARLKIHSDCGHSTVSAMAVQLIKEPRWVEICKILEWGLGVAKVLDVVYTNLEHRAEGYSANRLWRLTFKEQPSEARFAGENEIQLMIFFRLLDWCLDLYGSLRGNRHKAYITKR